MIEIILAILFYSLVVERVTEIVHASKIFLPLRNTIALRAYPVGADPLPPWRGWGGNSGELRIINWCLGRRIALFLNELISCGYCASVWVAMLFAFYCPLLAAMGIHYGLMDWITKVMILHGGANLYHVIYERAKKGRVQTFDIKVEYSDAGSDGEIESEESAQIDAGAPPAGTDPDFY